MEFIFSHAATGEILNLVRDAAILDSEVILEDILDAEYIED